MTRTGRMGRFVNIGLVIIVLVLIAGHAIGQPVLLSYVETGSMEPTLSPGDGFVVIPPVLSGGVETGDVVIYRAVHLHGGGLTTHRVVESTPEGYVMRGDANAFTDQAGGEPLVQRPQVLAEAVTVQGRPVVIPGLGTLVTAVRNALRSGVAVLGRTTGLWVRDSTTAVGLWVILTVIGLYLRGRPTAPSSPTPPRPQTQPPAPRRHERRLLLLGAVVVLAVATAGMTVPGGTQAFGIVSAENDGPGPRVIEAGSAETTTYLVRNQGLLPTYVVLDPRSAAIDVRPTAFRLGPGRDREIALTITAPDDTGYHLAYLEDRRYLLVLPQAAIRSLHDLHPWLAILSIDAFIAALVILAGRHILGKAPDAPRDGPSSPPSPGWSDR